MHGAWGHVGALRVLVVAASHFAPPSCLRRAQRTSGTASALSSTTAPTDVSWLRTSHLAALPSYWYAGQCGGDFQ